jgi:hypothetical protein
MSYKGHKSRVSNKKQFDLNYDLIKKIPPAESKVKKVKELVVPLTGRVTRYIFS